jgi:hypothetical protein
MPATAVAKPNKADRTNASKECRAERDAMGVENFKAQYGNFGKCVSQHAREEAAERKAAKREAKAECKAEGKRGKGLGRCVSKEAKENKAEADAEDQAELNAAETCRAEEKAIGEEAFAEKYGTNNNKKNAFGKCVSGHAQEQGDDETDDSEGDEPESGKPEETGAPDGTGKPEGVGEDS